MLECLPPLERVLIILLVSDRIASFSILDVFEISFFKLLFFVRQSITASSFFKSLIYPAGIGTNFTP